MIDREKMWVTPEEKQLVEFVRKMNYLTNSATELKQLVIEATTNPGHSGCKHAALDDTCDNCIS